MSNWIKKHIDLCVPNIENARLLTYILTNKSLIMIAVELCYGS